MRESSHMQKGEVKVSKRAKIFDTRIHKRDEQREVKVPAMNMSVLVKISDSRTNEEIVQAWAERNARTSTLSKPIKRKGGRDAE